MSTALSTWRLQPELTVLVLATFILDERDPDYDTLCSAVRVCKGWKAVGIPVLYRVVNLHTDQQLQSFQRQLMSSSYLDKNRLGPLIRRLWIGQNAMDEAVFSIVAWMPALEIFSAGTTSSYPLFVCLSAASGATLTSIDTRITPDSDGLFIIFNSLPNLRRLYILIIRGQWEHSLDHPLVNVSIMDILWDCDCYDDDALTFLSRSRFGPGSSIQLTMIGLSARGASRIAPLFDLNSFGEVLTLMPSEAISILVPKVTQSRKVTFFHEIPAPESWDNVTRPPDVLTLEYANKETHRRRRQDLFWNFLDYLSTCNLPGHLQADEQMTIYIKFDNNTDLDWFEGVDMDQKISIARLLKIAASLYRRGIALKDVFDRDVGAFAGM